MAFFGLRSLRATMAVNSEKAKEYKKKYLKNHRKTHKKRKRGISFFRKDASITSNVEQSDMIIVSLKLYKDTHSIIEFTTEVKNFRLDRSRPNAYRILFTMKMNESIQIVQFE